MQKQGWGEGGFQLFGLYRGKWAYEERKNAEVCKNTKSTKNLNFKIKKLFC
jgi:hypothetical protein